MSEYLKYLPALGRLGATKLVQPVAVGRRPGRPRRARAVDGHPPMARSLLFNLLFYVTTTLFVVLGSPLAVRADAAGPWPRSPCMPASSFGC